MVTRLGQVVRWMFAGAAISLFGPALADPPAEQFLQSRDDPEGVLYFTGITVGFAWANARLRQLGEPQLFCAPEHGALNYDQMMNIMSSYIRDHRSTAATPVGATLMLALQEAYPCKH